MRAGEQRSDPQKEKGCRTKSDTLSEQLCKLPYENRIALPATIAISSTTVAAIATATTAAAAAGGSGRFIIVVAACGKQADEQKGRKGALHGFGLARMYARGDPVDAFRNGLRNGRIR
ncbi:MAG: hypothetical protein KDD69_08970 [Bdellovibrionales bacterium]|nr:hypothetical protein [Bdellovibrionales bacterium]